MIAGGWRLPRSGKTTLLNVAGGMESPTTGSVVVAGEDITTYCAVQLSEYRRRLAAALLSQVPALRAIGRLNLAAVVRERSL